MGLNGLQTALVAMLGLLLLLGAAALLGSTLSALNATMW